MLTNKYLDTGKAKKGTCEKETVEKGRVPAPSNPKRSQACSRQCLADRVEEQPSMSQGGNNTWLDQPSNTSPASPIPTAPRSHRMLHTGSRFTNASEEIIPVWHNHYSWWFHFEHNWIKNGIYLPQSLMILWEQIHQGLINLAWLMT